jgi:hypothetical protein
MKKTRGLIIRRLAWFLAGLFLFTSCPQAGPSFQELISIASNTDLAKIGTVYPLGGNYRLAADITLSGWIPIGTTANPFSGSFDGNGHTITLKNFDNGVVLAAGNKYLGVFGYTRGASAGAAAEIRNVSVSSAISQTITTNGVCYAGVLAGYADQYTKFVSVSVSGSLAVNRAVPNGSAIYGGGIAGYMKNSSINDSVSSVSLDFPCTAESDGSPAGNAGGIAGYGANGTVITNCSASGSVQISSRGFQSGAGGIIGYVTGTASNISHCSASGNITMTGLYQQEFAGGIAGYSGGSATISKCRYTGGTVQSIGPGSQYPYAGGISGYNYGGAIIEECYSSGLVRAEGALIPYAGGVAGYTSAGSAIIKNSYSTMTVEAVSQGETALAGGIAAATANTGKISKCYAAGTVSATVNGQGSTGEGIGIVAGVNAGGISGSIYYGTPSIEYCAALNPSLTGTDSSSGAVFRMYRIAGKGTGGTNTLTDNYAWSGMELTGRGTVVPASAGADTVDGGDCTAKPDIGLYRDTLGWDFTNVWKMGGSGYPVLQRQN